jgi:molecular chaperone DnaK
LSGKLAERVYAQKSASEGEQSGSHASSGEHAADDGVVDAEFEEVKDEDKK